MALGSHPHRRYFRSHGQTRTHIHLPILLSRPTGRAGATALASRTAKGSLGSRPVGPGPSRPSPTGPHPTGLAPVSERHISPRLLGPKNFKNVLTGDLHAFKKMPKQPWLGGSLNWSTVSYTRRCGSDHRPGHTAGWRVRALVRECVGSSCLMFPSHIQVSLFPFLSL